MLQSMITATKEKYKCAPTLGDKDASVHVHES